jgi:TonB family protein
MSTLFVSTIAVSLVLLVGLAATTSMGRASAALRHWVLAVSLLCGLAVPLLQAVAPSLHLPAAATGVVTEQVAYRIVGANPAPVASSSAGPAQAAFQTWSILQPAWMGGVAISLSLLLIAMARLSLIGARSIPITDRRWLDILGALSREHGIQRPIALLESTHPTLLVTWGSRSPKVVLPAIARSWSDDRIRVVLSHELAHIVRRDWATQMLAEVLRSLYWFNPLVWIACRRLRRESEHACDDAVLNAGIDGSEYASHLLDLARVLRGHRMWSPAPAMARPSTLERRIRVMLNRRHNPRGLTRSTRVVTSIAILTVTLVIAGLTATAQTFSTVSGSIVDSQGASLADARLVLSNLESKAKYEVRSDRSGRFEFLGVTSGNFALEAIVPGFRRFQTNLTLSGNTVHRDIGLSVGTLEETITVTAGGPARSAEQMQKDELLGAQARTKFQQVLAECRAASAPVAGATVGGQIRPPRKIRDVRPLYPETARSAGIGGTAKLVATIGTEGLVTDVTSVDPTVNADLVDAAIAAVRQWEFDGTLLNCVPVEVEMTVSVGFDPAR